MMGLLFCIKVFCIAILCMCCVKALISETICVLFFRYGFMLKLLQNLVYFFQSVCSVDLVIVVVLCG